MVSLSVSVRKFQGRESAGAKGTIARLDPHQILLPAGFCYGVRSCELEEQRPLCHSSHIFRNKTFLAGKTKAASWPRTIVSTDGLDNEIPEKGRGDGTQV